MSVNPVKPPAGSAESNRPGGATGAHGRSSTAPAGGSGAPTGSSAAPPDAGADASAGDDGFQNAGAGVLFSSGSGGANPTTGLGSQVQGHGASPNAQHQPGGPSTTGPGVFHGHSGGTPAPGTQPGTHGRGDSFTGSGSLWGPTTGTGIQDQGDGTSIVNRPSTPAPDPDASASGLFWIPDAEPDDEEPEVPDAPQLPARRPTPADDRAVRAYLQHPAVTGLYGNATHGVVQLTRALTGRTDLGQLNNSQQGQVVATMLSHAPASYAAAVLSAAAQQPAAMATMAAALSAGYDRLSEAHQAEAHNAVTRLLNPNNLPRVAAGRGSTVPNPLPIADLIRQSDHSSLQRTAVDQMLDNAKGAGGNDKRADAAAYFTAAAQVASGNPNLAVDLLRRGELSGDFLDAIRPDNLAQRDTQHLRKAEPMAALMHSLADARRQAAGGDGAGEATVIAPDARDAAALDTIYLAARTRVTEGGTVEGAFRAFEAASAENSDATRAALISRLLNAGGPGGAKQLIDLLTDGQVELTDHAASRIVADLVRGGAKGDVRTAADILGILAQRWPTDRPEHAARNRVADALDLAANRKDLTAADMLLLFNALRALSAKHVQGAGGNADGVRALTQAVEKLAAESPLPIHDPEQLARMLERSGKPSALLHLFQRTLSATPGDLLANLAGALGQSAGLVDRFGSDGSQALLRRGQIDLMLRSDSVRNPLPLADLIVQSGNVELMRGALDSLMTSATERLEGDSAVPFYLAAARVAASRPELAGHLLRQGALDASFLNALLPATFQRPGLAGMGLQRLGADAVLGDLLSSLTAYQKGYAGDASGTNAIRHGSASYGLGGVVGDGSHSQVGMLPLQERQAIDELFAMIYAAQGHGLSLPGGAYAPLSLFERLNAGRNRQVRDALVERILDAGPREGTTMLLNAVAGEGSGDATQMGDEEAVGLITALVRGGQHHRTQAAAEILAIIGGESFEAVRDLTMTPDRVAQTSRVLVMACVSRHLDNEDLQILFTTAPVDFGALGQLDASNLARLLANEAPQSFAAGLGIMLYDAWYARRGGYLRSDWQEDDFANTFGEEAYVFAAAHAIEHGGDAITAVLQRIDQDGRIDSVVEILSPRHLNRVLLPRRRVSATPHNKGILGRLIHTMAEGPPRDVHHRMIASALERIEDQPYNRDVRHALDAYIARHGKRLASFLHDRGQVIVEGPDGEWIQAAMV
ncbi:MAG: hypothetical protein AAF772_03340 [Acidobacteriota bacterium]